MVETDILVKRFLRYVSFDTQSDEENDTVCPSTPGQLVFARALADELRQIGMQEVTLDDNGYVMATLPSDLSPTSTRAPKRRAKTYVPCSSATTTGKISC